MHIKVWVPECAAPSKMILFYIQIYITSSVCEKIIILSDSIHFFGQECVSESFFAYSINI